MLEDYDGDSKDILGESLKDNSSDVHTSQSQDEKIVECETEKIQSLLSETMVNVRSSNFCF